MMFGLMISEDLLSLQPRRREIILLNSKSEFHQAPLTRLVAFTGLHGDQREEQAGHVFPGVGEAGAGGRARAGRRVGAGRD